MKYMLLIHSDPTAGPTPGTPAFDKLLADYHQVTGDMKEAGVYVGGNALMPTHTAKTLRVRSGKRDVIDGPFAETKEALGGYYVLECPDLDAAIDWAARLPEVQWGTIEIRPVMEFG